MDVPDEWPSRRGNPSDRTRLTGRLVFSTRSLCVLPGKRIALHIGSAVRALVFVAIWVARERLSKHDTNGRKFGLKVQLACKPWWLLCDGTVGGDWYAYSFLSICLRGVGIGDVALQL